MAELIMLAMLGVFVVLCNVERALRTRLTSEAAQEMRNRAQPLTTNDRKGIVHGYQ